MASNIKIKRSETAGNPTTLGAGELAYSALVDNGSNGGDRLYIGMGTETAGNAVNHVVIGGKYFTDMITAATNANNASTLVKRDASGNFSAGTITAALSGNASTATTWATGRTLSLTGDVTYTSPSIDGSGNVTAAATLATSGVAAGTYGSATSIPVLVVDAKGRITSASNTSITVGDAALTLAMGAAGATNTSVTIGTGTGFTANDTAATTYDIKVGPALTNLATFMTTATAGFIRRTAQDTYTIDTATYLTGDQAVSTTSNVTFNNVTVSGSLTSDDITSANVTVTGNLTVTGTTTTINSTAVAISDINLTLAKDAATAAAANGAGLTVAGAGATLTYTSADDRWNFNKSLNVGTVYGALSGNASTATTAGTWTTARDLSLTGDATATLSAVNGSAAVSAVLTLATVNSNTGSFGNGTTIPSITVNAKGLITAVTTTAIATATASVLGLAKFDSTNFLVTAGLVTVATIDGGTY